MVAKNIKGKGFGGCVRYVMEGTAELLEAEGIFAESAQSIVRSFVMQQSQRREIKQPVGSITTNPSMGVGIALNLLIYNTVEK